MNNKFDELAKGLAQSVTRRQAFKKFGVRSGRPGAGLLRVGKQGGGVQNAVSADRTSMLQQPQCCSGKCEAPGGPTVGKIKLCAQNNGVASQLSTFAASCSARGPLAIYVWCLDCSTGMPVAKETSLALLHFYLHAAHFSIDPPAPTQWPPLVQEYFHRSPHRHPTGDG